MFEILGKVVYLEVGLFLGGMLSVMFYQILIGKINFKGLLVDKEDGRMSPVRVQLVMVTLVVGLAYLNETGSAPAGTLPPVSEELLLVLGGSHGVYLVGKSKSLLAKQIARVLGERQI